MTPGRGAGGEQVFFCDVCGISLLVMRNVRLDGVGWLACEACSEHDKPVMTDWVFAPKDAALPIHCDFLEPWQRWKR